MPEPTAFYDRLAEHVGIEARRSDLSEAAIARWSRLVVGTKP